MSETTDDAVQTPERDASAVGRTDEPAPTSISRDDAYHLLQNKRRRATLRYLLANAEHERFVMRDLAEVVAAWEHDTTVQQLASRERQRVYIALYQSHLPKLAEHGIIDYNQSRGVVELKPLARALEPLLDVGDGLDASETISVAPADETSDGTGSSSRTKELLSKFGIA